MIIIVSDRGEFGEFWVIDTVGLSHSSPLVLLAFQNMEESKIYGFHVESIVLGLTNGLSCIGNVLLGLYCRDWY